jgi:hypothetical protein
MTNQQLFSIGIFPFLALGTALLFFPPDWPRFRWLRARHRPPRQPIVASWPAPPRGWRLRPAKGVLLGVLGVYLALQVLMPLRHFAIPGNVSWTEEGHRFSWHMKLRDKDADAQFEIVAADGSRSLVDPSQYLTNWQYDEMSSRPDMIVQFARHVKEKTGSVGLGDVEVRAQVAASLNGRDEQTLIEPEVDVSEVELQGLLGHADWVVPLRTPLN